MLPKKIAFVDIETTGCNLNYDRIIEIGIVRVEEGAVTKTYQTLLDPQCYIPQEITNITGISPALLENSPTFRQVSDEIQEILNDCVFVAHNVRFDYGFLKSEFRRLGINFSPKHFCTVKLSRNLYPHHRRHNLDSLVERFGFECSNRHRAFDDAYILWEFYQAAQKNFSEDQLIKALGKALKRPSTPINISQKIIDKLPEKPGVYIFYGEDGCPLYIGKSVNIRERVMSHFCADHSSGTEMKISQQVKSIETIETAGELGALFKESSLIKKYQPLYNRKLRRTRKLIVLRKIENFASQPLRSKTVFPSLRSKRRACEDSLREAKQRSNLDSNQNSGVLSSVRTQNDSFLTPSYHTISLETLEYLDVSDLSSILGIFRSRKQAQEFLIQASKKHNLCEKLLGLEKTKGACFGYRLGRCKGACVNKETILTYNMKFDLAFLETKIRSWPFNDSIAIQEEDPQTGKKESYIFDKWCYLGCIKNDTEIDTTSFEKDLVFDLDTYKILSSFIRNPKNTKKIKTFSLSRLKSESRELENDNLFNQLSF